MIDPSTLSLKRLVTVLRERTNGELETFLVAQKLCPECAEPLVKAVDSETVCSCCGLVVPRFDMEKNVPMGETRSPTNQLGYGRVQGFTLQEQGLWSVLAEDSIFKCKICNKTVDDRRKHLLRHGIKTLDRKELIHYFVPLDLPLRTRHIKNNVRFIDHPKIKAMLTTASSLANDYGFSSHDDNKSIRFSNELGRIIRAVGSYVAVTGDRMPTTLLAKACFLVTFQYVHAPWPRGIAEELKVPKQVYESVWRLYKDLKNLRKNGQYSS